MKSILIKFKNFLPYLTIISIYFFFINIEAQKDQMKIQGSVLKNKSIKNKSIINDTNIIIEIPVIPYN